jgi:hypothetical protein
VVSTTIVTTPGTAPAMALVPCAYRLPVPSAAPAAAPVEGPFLGSTGPVTGGELRPATGRRAGDEPAEGARAFGQVFGPAVVPAPADADGPRVPRVRGDHQRPFPVLNLFDRTPSGGPDPGRSLTATAA